jgi:hypothetical protein
MNKLDQAFNDIVDFTNSVIHYFEDLYGYPWGHVIVIGLGVGLQVSAVIMALMFGN